MVEKSANSVLNQYPDIEADKKVGRHHFPIAFGLERSNLAYGTFSIATIVVISMGVYLGYLPALAMIALIPMPLSFWVWFNMIKYKDNIAQYPQVLGANVVVSLVVPLLVAISMMLA